MGNHPFNLFIRFLLEISALIIVGIWGWKIGEDWMQYLLGLGLPIVLASIWGIFAVPNDTSRSGSAPIPTPGLVRLLIELVFFGLASWALYDLGLHELSFIYAIAVVVHYAVSYDRIRWLLSDEIREIHKN